ncbi:hypothetical protein [Muriicola soli]|uniref:Uncharacterized protein n=1 Tax=Muriicola soli TaxID=2507538 RepID=A0A411EBC6_9FLAO|nr:hypothetical protein [Muriicola soli]QBA64969.1 hypothetical protein EQY75_10785 [Muriicola soli]
MILLSQILVVFFGIFLITVGFLMLLTPNRIWRILNKAASTPLIHFGELSLRMIPAAGLIIYAPHSTFPDILQILGWFMLATSIILMLLPRAWHYAYAQKCANMLSPYTIRLIAPLSFAFGGFVLFACL